MLEQFVKDGDGLGIYLDKDSSIPIRILRLVTEEVLTILLLQ